MLLILNVFEIFYDVSSGPDYRQFSTFLQPFLCREILKHYCGSGLFQKSTGPLQGSSFIKIHVYGL